MAKEIFQLRERLSERDEEVAELKAERSNIKVGKFLFISRSSIPGLLNKQYANGSSALWQWASKKFIFQLQGLYYRYTDIMASFLSYRKNFWEKHSNAASQEKYF